MTWFVIQIKTENLAIKFGINFTAGPRESVFPGFLTDHPHHRWQTEPGHLAGHLAVRAPESRWLPQSAGDPERVHEGL